MIQFEVQVFQQRVVVIEKASRSERHDVHAKVDGEYWQYRIKNKTETKNDKTWRERGIQQAFYHAKNSGHTVRFLGVERPNRRRKQKISDKQIALF